MRKRPLTNRRRERTIMASDAPDAAQPPKITGQQKLLVAAVGVLFFTWLLWLGTARLPTGKENRRKARDFLKEVYPQRLLAPEDSVTAPVAALFQVIRTGEPAVSRRAIDFAA